VRPAAPLIGDWAKGISGNSGGVKVRNLLKLGGAGSNPLISSPVMNRGHFGYV